MQYAAVHAASKSDTKAMILLKAVATGPHWNVATDTLISFQTPHSNSCINVGTLDRSVRTVTRLKAGRVKNRCSIPGRGKRLPCFPTSPQQRNGGTCHPPYDYWLPGTNCTRMNLTTHLYPVPRLRMSGAIPPTHMDLWQTKGHIYITMNAKVELHETRCHNYCTFTYNKKSDCFEERACNSRD